jgi:hypothetical protein
MHNNNNNNNRIAAYLGDVLEFGPVPTEKGLLGHSVGQETRDEDLVAAIHVESAHDLELLQHGHQLHSTQRRGRAHSVGIEMQSKGRKEAGPNKVYLGVEVGRVSGRLPQLGQVGVVQNTILE